MTKVTRPVTGRDWLSSKHSVSILIRVLMCHTGFVDTAEEVTEELT
jgi:hypothetical protein